MFLVGLNQAMIAELAISAPVAENIGMAFVGTERKLKLLGIEE